MSVNFGGKKVTAFPGIYIKAKDMISDAVVAFDVVNTTPVTATGKYFLYVASDGSLRFNNGSTITTIGAAGSVSSGTWDGIYSADKTLTIGSGTLTFAGNASDGVNVFTVTNIAGSTGAAIQITNDTTSNPDIKGTSDTWKVLGTGAATFLSVTLSGTAGSTVQTITAGDVVYSDGSLAITDADDAASFSVTNNSATTAPMVVLASSGAHTGNTTNALVTLTSGVTTGTLLYAPMAALTTGKGISLVANAVTDGLVLNITSSSTVHTATGRLLNVASTAATNTSAVLNEFATAANDETVLLRLTASDVLAAGKMLHFSASSLTTGTALDMAALDALTDGFGVNIGSSCVTMSSTGRLLNVAHTGNATVSGIIAEFATAAADETILMRLTASAALTGVGAVLDVKGVGITTGNGIKMINLDALTSGLGLAIASSATAITGAGRLLSVDHTGTTSSTGTIVEFKTAATDAVNVTTLLKLTAAALVTGVVLDVSSTTGMTTGSLVRVASSSAGAYATNGAISFTSTGNFTSTSAVNGGFVEVKANSTTAGTIFNLVGSGLTTGIGMQLSNGTSAMTSGSLLRVTTSGTGIIATNGIVSITHAGIYTSTANAGVLDVRASAVVGDGTVVNFMSTAASQLTSTVLNVENSGFTTGYTGSMLRIKSPTTTGACKVVDLIADGITSGGVAMNISVAALTTGDGLVITNGTAATTTGSLLKVTAGGTGAVSSDGLVSFQHSGVYTSTTVGFVNVSASATTGGTVMTVTGAAVTDGTGFQISNASITSGKHFNVLGAAGASMFSISVSGATVIAGVALGTAALTVSAGDLVLSSGKITVVGGILSSAPTGSGIGYATGAGSTVTQLTNRSTGVTINTLCGKIQTDTTSLAAGASAEFTVTNSTVAIGDVVVVSQRSGSSNVAGVAGVTVVEVVTVAAGSFIVSVNNQSTTTAETGAIVINFAVIKAVTA